MKKGWKELPIGGVILEAANTKIMQQATGEPTGLSLTWINAQTA